MLVILVVLVVLICVIEFLFVVVFDKKDVVFDVDDDGDGDGTVDGREGKGGAIESVFVCIAEVAGVVKEKITPSDVVVADAAADVEDVELVLVLV